MRDLLGMMKSAIGVPNNDIDEYDEDEYDEDDRGSSEYRRSRASDQYEEKLRKVNISTTPNNKVVSLPHEANDMKVVVLSPNQYDDARTVCDHLKAWAPVIVKLDRLDREEAQRVVDFIMGACYTMDGHVQEIKEDVFLIAPSMINIEKEVDEIKTNKSNSFFSKFSVR